MKDYVKYRLFELIPGLLVWFTFILAIILSFIRPIWVIYFVIVFDLYWLFRVSYFSFWLILSYRRYRHDIKINWLEKIKKINNWEEYYHIVFLPFYNEPYEVIETTFESLIHQNYPLNKFIIVLAGEERNKKNALDVSNKIKNKYGHYFFKFIFTLHPDNIEGELKGKGANAHFAGKEVKKLIDKWNLDYEKLIVSYFDCDTCTHPEYFSYLTYTFLTHPDPYHTSFQPVALYNNNIWQSNLVTRVVAFGTTFWLLSELARPDRLFTFSSHSMSWKALVDVGFWQKDIVTDDSRIFLQCFLRYDGNYTVTPMYIPISMDTVEAQTIIQSFKNLYKQQRRWAWGVEHFPYMLWHFWQNKAIPKFKKFKYLWNLGEGMYSWATAPILIFVLGRLPLWRAQDLAPAFVLNVPFLLEWLMRFAMVGIFVSAIISILLLPPKPKKEPSYKYIIMILQWALLPITLIVWGSIPAIEAQTRLLLGKYLGFFNTPKQRSGKSSNF